MNRGTRVAQFRSLVLRLMIFSVLSVAALAQQTSPASIVIDAARVEGPISPILYGQFDEFMFEGVKGGLDAEMIRDRSFDQQPNAIGLPRYWERDPDDRNDDPALHFYWDAKVFYPPARKVQSEIADHSLRIELGSNDGQRRGIRQGDIPVRKGSTYQGYFWAKTQDFAGTIRVALEADQTDGESYASAEVRNVAGDWKKYTFSLTSTEEDQHAKLAILPFGRGRLWLDQVSLLPADAIDGVRKDVYEKVRELHPAFIRWPGGNVAQDYHWKWGVGLRDERPSWINLSWGKELEPGNFGTDEFVALCRNVGAEPSLTVNVEGRGATAQEAAQWVEYANGPAGSTFGALRASSGHPEPFKVKFWEVGNEIWGNWVRGHSDAATYAGNLARYAVAMRAADPSIRLIGVGDNNMNWNRTVLQSSGKYIDYLAIHHYYGASEMHGDASNLMAHPLAYERFYKQVAQAIHELAPQHKIQLAINEWNTSLPTPRQHSMESALYAARLMNVFERSDIVAMSAVSDLVNGWSGGVIQASRHRVFVTPTYLVNQLYASHLGSERLATRVESPSFDSSREGKNIPYLDVVVSRTPDGKHIFIHAVNTDPERVLRTQVRVTGAKPADQAQMEVLNGESLTSANSFSSPTAVSIKSSTVAAGESFTVDLPQHSVSVISLELH